jgi:hypothetical protein
LRAEINKKYYAAPVPRLRMSGTIPSLHQFVVMARCLIKQTSSWRGA